MMKATSISLKYIADISKGKKPIYEITEEREGFLPYLSMDFLRGRNGLTSFVDVKNENVVTVNERDILIIWDGSNSGEIVFGQKGVLSSTMGKIELNNNKFSKEFVGYFLISSEMFLRSNTVGMGIPHVNGEVLRNLKIPIIPLFEQQKITAYLDYKTQTIDAVISKKERLLALLEEKKKALINDLVTGKKVWNGKEYNKPAKTKDSGIEWLGEIPEHWEVKKLGFLGQCQNGVSKGGDYFGSGYPFVNYGDIYNNFEIPKAVKGLANSTDEDRKIYSVEAGDVFFTRTSETIDEIGIASTCIETLPNSVFSGFTIRFRPYNDSELKKGFSKFFFRGNFVRVFLVKEMNLVTRASLSQTLLKSLPVILPPLSEQKLIAEYLEEKFSQFDDLKTKLVLQIAKLKEYRQVVISEAVSGKIDVRGWKLKA